MERYPLAALNRITTAIVVLSLAIAGWIAYQHLEDNAPPAATPVAHPS